MSTYVSNFLYSPVIKVRLTLDILSRPLTKIYVILDPNMSALPWASPRDCHSAYAGVLHRPLHQAREKLQLEGISDVTLI